MIYSAIIFNPYTLYQNASFWLLHGNVSSFFYVSNISKAAWEDISCCFTYNLAAITFHNPRHVPRMNFYLCNAPWGSGTLDGLQEFLFYFLSFHLLRRFVENKPCQSWFHPRSILSFLKLNSFVLRKWNTILLNDALPFKK